MSFDKLYCNVFFFIEARVVDARYQARDNSGPETGIRYLKKLKRLHGILSIRLINQHNPTRCSSTWLIQIAYHGAAIYSQVLQFNRLNKSIVKVHNNH